MKLAIARLRGDKWSHLHYHLIVSTHNHIRWNHIYNHCPHIHDIQNH